MFDRVIQKNIVYTICEDCGCMIAEGREQVVTRDSVGNFTSMSPLTYCGRCKPPYDEILYHYGLGATADYIRVDKPKPSRVPVTKDGKKIKSKK